MSKCVLYVGGFVLPDKNAAAQRVIGVAKGLRDIGYKVIFLNRINISSTSQIVKKIYFGFECYEYGQDLDVDYLFRGNRLLEFVKKINPDIVLTYNYPALPLNRLRKYANRHGIKCYADVTEWYVATGKRVLYRIVKNLDCILRMEYVHRKMDGVIVISRFLYDYYKDKVSTVLIPPTVDIFDSKWDCIPQKSDKLSLVYAGVPSAQKEQLNVIVDAVDRIPSSKRVELNIVGITMEQYRKIYNWKKDISDRVVFWGRVNHEEALNIIKKANWSIILRDNNKVVRAGFPTKLVESISCCTPVIVNKFSNIEDYLDKNNSIVIDDFSKIETLLCDLKERSITINREVFDYRNYVQELKELLD